MVNFMWVVSRSFDALDKFNILVLLHYYFILLTFDMKIC